MASHAGTYLDRGCRANRALLAPRLLLPKSSFEGFVCEALEALFLLVPGSVPLRCVLVRAAAASRWSQLVCRVSRRVGAHDNVESGEHMRICAQTSRSVLAGALGPLPAPEVVCRTSGLGSRPSFPSRVALHDGTGRPSHGACPCRVSTSEKACALARRLRALRLAGLSLSTLLDGVRRAPCMVPTAVAQSRQ